MGPVGDAGHGVRTRRLGQVRLVERVGEGVSFWGYPVWFRLLIGALEIGAALMLFWPRTAAYGAAAIIVVMVGGMGTHVFIEHRLSRVTSELLHLIFASFVLAGRWHKRIQPWAR